MLSIVQTPVHYEVSFPFNYEVKDAVKAVPGARWNPVDKLWTLPLDKGLDVQLLIGKYGGSIKKSSTPEIAPVPELPELTIDIPLKRPLFPYQAKGVAQGLKYKCFINGDEPGLGKTQQAIATVIGAQCKCILVICPATLKINWQREFEIVAGKRSIILTPSVKNTWHQYYKVGMCNVFITNYESLKTYFVDRIEKPEDGKFTLKNVHFKDTISLFDAVIIDELHRCKETKTLQSKLTKGICNGKEYIIGLTGTPVVNKPKDLLSQLGIINRLHMLGGYKTFMMRYCGGDGKGATNLQELNYVLSTTCFFKRRKKDVLTELPDKTYQVVTCDITTRKEYEEALKDLSTYLQKWKNKTDAEVEKSLRGEIMVRIGVCKNISARGKLNETFEQIDEVIESGEKIVVFIHQKEIAQHLIKRYPKAVTVRGDDSNDARDRNVRTFQNDPKVNIIICSIKAAGVGLTLTASSRVLFVELPWHAADVEQCVDRTHRIGQKNAVLAKFLLGGNTIDEYIYKLIESKRGVANEVTGTVDDVQREIIDKLADSLFNVKNMEQQENEKMMINKLAEMNQ